MGSSHRSPLSVPTPVYIFQKVNSARTMNIVMSMSIRRKKVWISASILASSKKAQQMRIRGDLSTPLRSGRDDKVLRSGRDDRRSQRSITATVTNDGIRAVNSTGSHMHVGPQNSRKNINSQKNNGGLSV